MAEARALKLCTKGGYIKSGPSDDKSPLKGAWFCSRDPFLYAQLWNRKKIINTTRSAAIHNVADGGQPFMAYTALVASLRLRPKFRWFDLSQYFLQSWL